MDREYKSALHRYVAAYIDLNHASLDPDGEAAAVAVSQFYLAADVLSRKKEEKYGSFEIPNLDRMLNRDEKVSRLALSRIRSAIVNRGCGSMEQLEMEEAYSYAMFLERGKIKEERLRKQLILRHNLKKDYLTEAAFGLPSVLSKCIKRQ